MNYGAMGSLIGHEITHAFDDQGSQFDKFGNAVEWWTKKSKKSFLEKADCIIQKYGNFTIEEVKLQVSFSYTL